MASEVLYFTTINIFDKREMTSESYKEEIRPADNKEKEDKAVKLHQQKRVSLLFTVFLRLRRS